ncbi:MAG: hypothetical protein ABIE42_05120 [Candidatus Eisenbacteria bacterium]
MFLDGAVRTTVSPTAATVFAFILLLCATGPVLGTDESGGGGEPAVLEEGGSPADSAMISTVPPDSLAPTTLFGVVPDSLGTAGADSLPAVAEPEIARAPYAPGVSVLPKRDSAFFRPWSLVDARPKGLAVGRPSMPPGAPSSVPFSRRVVVDHENGTMTIVTDVGKHTSWVSYAAPLAEYQRLAGDAMVLEAWEKVIHKRLGRAETGQGRGLLDIDIPMPLPGPFVRAIGPGANLKVRGSERITFGGQTSYVVEALETESGRPSRFPQLDMQQQLTVNLEGTIGRKIHVYVDHRSGGDTFGGSKADQIRVHYEGDEDEIIQKIELGEVNLSLPGTEFVSYSGHHQGLFGAKMTAKVGKLELVTVASKEEGKSAGANFTGTSESDSLVIRDISYRAGKFFVIDDLALKYSNVGAQNIRVYLDDRISSNDTSDGAQEGIAYLEEPPGAAPPADATYSREGFFVELIENEDYFIPQGSGIYGEESGYQLGVIVLTRPITQGKMLAVSYGRVTDGGGTVSVGGYDAGSQTLYLKLMKHDDSTTPTGWERTRLYELKHIYDLGAEDIPEEGFQLTIRRSAASGEDQEVHESGVPYTKLLGLDTEEIGVGSSDVDPTWLDLTNGLLSFPHFTPFCPDYDTTGFYYAPDGGPDPIYYADEFSDSEKNCSVYSKDNFDAGDDDYYIVVKYNRPRTTFYLGQINIIENSEVVRLNGVRLTRGTDYTIYYPAGQLTILAEEAKEPDAKVTVEYDYKPFGIAGEKTLLGARGVYNWSEKIRLGTTWMYQSKGTPEDRPRLGEEPSRTVVGDVNLSADFTPELMTRVVDAIPFIETDAESRLKISAEAAVSIPNPNTKGFVSVDDMEGAENVSMLGVSRRLWVPSSVPDLPEIDASDRMDIYWYNPERKVQEGDLHPDLPAQEADDSHTVLEIAYDSDGSASWAGLMRLLSKTGSDYSDYQFVELWVNDGAPIEQSTGTFYIDLGNISEDYYPLMSPNGELETEDVDVPPNGFDADEDVGLDTVAGVDGQGVPGDDGDDDYKFEYDSDDYSKINGTEGNERLDTEDLNGNGYVDQDNSYWTLTVDLADTTYRVQDNSKLVAGNYWRKYRFPLSHAESPNGMATWTSIKSARIWANGLAVGAGEIMIGSMDIVGSQWEPRPIVDEDGEVVPDQNMGDMGFRVGTKNTKEDVDYDPPFDPGIDEDTNLPKREQSIFLLYENLRSEHTASARKVFYSEEDYTGYQSFDFYLHGGAAVEDGTVFFMRLGRDSLNYYEYSLEVRSGWLQDRSSGDNLLTVPFTSFTDLKLGEFATLDEAETEGAYSGETFRRVGWPSLSRIRRLTVGIRNEAAAASDITGEVWLDDIRLSEVRRDLGWAERATVEARFADFLDVDFDLRHVDGEFHSLKQLRGSGQDNITYNFTGTMNADRFVSALGVSTPVNVTWKRSVSRPKFSSGSDIVLDEEQSASEKTETLDRSIAVSLSRKRQSPDFWTHLLVDGLSLRASLAEHEKASPTKADTSRTLRGRLSYRYSPEKQGLRLFGNTELFLKPTSFRFNTDVHLIRTQNYDISAIGVKTQRSNNHDKKLNADAGIDFQFLENLRTSHSVAVKRDLEPINRVVYDLNAGVETERRYSNSLSFNPKFGRWFAPQYSFSSSFTDNHGPQVRRAGDPFGIRDVRAQNNQDIRASFDIKKLLGPASTPRSGTPRGRRETREGGDREEKPTETSGDADEETAPRVDERTDAREAGRDSVDENGDGDEPPTAPSGEGNEPPTAPSGEGGEPPAATRGEGETSAEEGDEGALGPGFGDLIRPVLTLVRNTDAIEARYSIKTSSRYDRITAGQLPDWSYRLGLSSGEGADDRTEERTLSLDSGLKVTSQVRVKGSYKRTTGGRWYKNALSDSVTLTTETGSTSESGKGTLSWNGIEKLGPLSNVCSKIGARSGVEYKRSHSGPADEPTTRAKAFGMNPVISVDTTFKNGVTGNFSWDKRTTRSYILTGAGSVNEDDTGSMSLSLNYRFSAPQGLKLPFFGQKLKFQSNLDTSLTLRTSAKVSRTAQDEHGLLQVDPTSSTRDFSVTTDLTYSFSRSVSGGLQISFSQSRDEKRDQTRRTIGMHLSAEFKF